MTSRLLSRRGAVLLFLPLLATQAGAETLDEIVVTADLRGRKIEELPASASVLTKDDVESLATQHFEELVGVIPNMNWSGDGHRARYFQIRGVGELEQYQGAPNPSIGFLIDDIDFSGIGTIATLFDVERVEVLRGSQGSRYGANALGGLVYIQSVRPTIERSGRLQLTAGGDDAYSAGLAFGGPLTKDERALFRFSAQYARSDGFRENTYLSRDDTNSRRETTVRGRLALAPNDAIDIDIAAIYADIDDGYDAFALDNSYTMLSDKPGKDAQQSAGASLRVDWSGLAAVDVTSITTAADSDIEFGFDADWGNDDSWAPFTYDFTSVNDRRRQTLSQEFRVASASPDSLSWLAGLYALRLEDELDAVNEGEYFDPLSNFADSLLSVFGSDYRATNIAAFGHVERTLGNATRISAGLRVERRSADYSDTDGLVASPSETMTGGELNLSHDLSDLVTGYIGLSRGYKAGGFNLGVVPDGLREFSDESMWNFEVGIKSATADSALRVNAALFLSRRDDQQVRTSFQLLPGDPASFGFVTVNAEKGQVFGVEADVHWLVNDALLVYASAGLLDASFDEFSLQPDLEGRDHAHAPRYTVAAGVEWRGASGWFARVDASGKGDFYFDVSHDQKSVAYELVNARIGFETERWSARLWVRNLFDQDYAVRGFFFGNEPPNFAPMLYSRTGDPRQVGVTFDMRL